MRPGLSDKDKRLAFKVSGGALNLLNLETIDCPLPNCAIHRSAPALRNLQIVFTTSVGGISEFSHNLGSGWVLLAVLPPHLCVVGDPSATARTSWDRGVCAVRWNGVSTLTRPSQFISPGLHGRSRLPADRPTRQGSESPACAQAD